MSDLEKAQQHEFEKLVFRVLDLNHPDYQAAFDGFVAICNQADAARRFASLTSPETIEKAALKMVGLLYGLNSDNTIDVWENDMSDADRARWRRWGLAVLRSVEEGKT